MPKTKRPPRRRKAARPWTDFRAKALKPAKKPREHCGPDGLRLRVFPSGIKTWVFVYSFKQRRRRLTLGRYPDIGIVEAGAAHSDARMQLRKGVDPGAVKRRRLRAIQEAPTVAQLVEDYIERHAKPKKKSWRDDERILLKEVVAEWGERKAADVKRYEVIALLDEIVARPAPVMANRTLAALRKCYNWGITRDLVESSPCLQVPRPALEEQRERYLTRKEIAAFLKALRTGRLKMSETTQAALQLVLATGQRPGEVSGASWEEIDLEDESWEIPGERTKNGHSHRVPLNAPALAALEQALALNEESAWIFPTPAGDRPMRPLTLTQALRRNREKLQKLKVEPFSAHDLRRTCATNLAALGVTRFVIGRVLNHSERGATRVYDRHLYLEEMREALDLWGERLEELGCGTTKGRGDGKTALLGPRQR
ncbi:MAG: tyrosine-type recombinase/integrase [Candidatus Eisenbacteria sp.]|nr:tyrosine-type recombinase/integrase [Candidatus Eisenbacteria bacterium]